MRIAFCGASGTGKSTLARFVAEKWNLPINPIGSRSVAAAMGFSSPYDVDKADGDIYEGMAEQPNIRIEAAARSSMEHYAYLQEGWRNAARTVRPAFQRRLQAEKIAWEESQLSFVTDRSPLDDLAYAVLHCREIVDEAFLARAEAHTRTYDVLFYCPLSAGQWLADDPARVKDPAYHVVYDALIYGLISALSVPYRPIHPASLDSRKAKVDDTLMLLRDGL